MEVKKIIETPVSNTGYIHEDPPYEDYRATKLYGAVGFVGTDSPLDEPPIIFPNGKGWLQVAKEYGISEKQFNDNFDTYSCVIFTIAKAICYYLFKVYGVKITIAEMYNAFYAAVKPNQGTTFNKGFLSFYKHGWVEDWEYPIEADTTLAEFMQEPPRTIQLKAEGKLTEWDFHFEVIPKTLKAISENYKKTPVVLSGFAWASMFGEGIFYDNGNQANHAFLGLELNDKGNNIIDDTYPRERGDIDLTKDDMLKELHKSFKYGSAYRCWLTPKDKKKTSLLTLLKNMQDFYYYWDTKKLTHNFYYIGVPHGETKNFRQFIDWNTMTENEKFLFLALRKSMNQSNWGEISSFRDIKEIGKSFTGSNSLKNSVPSGF